MEAIGDVARRLAGKLIVARECEKETGAPKYADAPARCPVREETPNDVTGDRVAGRQNGGGCRPANAARLRVANGGSVGSKLRIVPARCWHAGETPLGPHAQRLSRPLHAATERTSWQRV